uniref:Uncharacterized protein n=1 Tax=Anguilla anguilla TaxID=7936 RepID=A0A0E9RL14_ANGAN
MCRCICYCSELRLCSPAIIKQKYLILPS